MSTAKVVIITGASGGIGKACAAYLSAHGYSVYGTSRSASDKVEKAGLFSMIRMDITDTESVARGIRTVMEREGRVDAVVNNAGLHVIGPIEQVSISDMEQCWRTNCLGAMQVCREVLPIMRRQGQGHIINISSVGGVVGLPFQGAYSGSKFALEGMTESLRAEVRGFGIRVSLIQPSDIRHQDCRSDTKVTDDYEDTFARASAIAWKDEEKGYPVERIGRLIEKIINNPRPRERYTFGKAFQRVVPMLKRILPNHLMELILRLYYKV